MVEMRWLKYEETVDIVIKQWSEKLQYRFKIYINTPYEQWSTWIDVPTVKESDNG